MTSAEISRRRRWNAKAREHAETSLALRVPMPREQEIREVYLHEIHYPFRRMPIPQALARSPERPVASRFA
jgi:hypothetical protein